MRFSAPVRKHCLGSLLHRPPFFWFPFGSGLPGAEGGGGVGSREHIWCSAARPPLPPPPHGIPPPVVPCGVVPPCPSPLWLRSAPPSPLWSPCPSPLWLRSAAPPSMAIAGWASGVRLLRVWTVGCDTVPTCPELQSQ